MIQQSKEHSEPGFLDWCRAAFRGHLLAVLGLMGVGLFITLALFAPLIAPQDPYDQTKLDILDGLLPPGSTLFDGTYSVMGTDALGRDIPVSYTHLTLPTICSV